MDGGFSFWQAFWRSCGTFAFIMTLIFVGLALIFWLGWVFIEAMEASSTGNIPISVPTPTPIP